VGVAKVLLIHGSVALLNPYEQYTTLSSLKAAEAKATKPARASSFVTAMKAMALWLKVASMVSLQQRIRVPD
jgi:uncharacterized membrane-anchored protein